ncbi:MAG TPA: hypothetical protein VD902_01850 [Symbiobacteriaceae bacterium]|nr:hypothetical protein [Symbiobacteriaceae bacterium]
MAAAAQVSQPEKSPGLRTAQILTALVLILTTVVAAGGIFIPGLYRFAPRLVIATQGQDLITLLSLPVMLVAMLAAKRGSVRGAITWIGILGYVSYSAMGAAFGYNMNEFFLIYVALFSLTVFALVAGVSSLHVAGMEQRFDAAAPRRAVAGFLTLMALLLSALWLSRIIPNMTVNPIPDTIEPYKYVYALDLGIIIPLMLLAAIWLWRWVTGGYLLAGCMLIKAVTMGLALLSMNLFNLRAGQPLDPTELLASYAFIAAGSLGMVFWLFRHCRG